MAIAFTHFQTITIWNHVFTPKEWVSKVKLPIALICQKKNDFVTHEKEFFYERLERAFPAIIVKLVNAEPEVFKRIA